MCRLIFTSHEIGWNISTRGGDEKHTDSSHKETEGNIPFGKPRPPCIDRL
jgi:hypothetical protein